MYRISLVEIYYPRIFERLWEEIDMGCNKQDHLAGSRTRKPVNTSKLVLFITSHTVSSAASLYFSGV